MATTDRKTAGNKRQFPVPALGKTKQAPEKEAMRKAQMYPSPHKRLAQVISRDKLC